MVEVQSAPPIQRTTTARGSSLTAVPPRKKASSAPPALTDADVSALRARVQAGEKPRVVVRAASAAVPAGTRGNIVRIGNPSEGEYVVVRLGRDEVPFAPSELGISGRAITTKAAPAPARKITERSAARKASAAKTSAPAKATAPAKSAATTAKSAAPAPAKSVAKKAARPSKRGSAKRSLPPLVVTLRFNDGGWTVEAARGARRIAKSSPVRPGAVKAFADLVDDATVSEALTETIESCRSVVEERAASLRAELQAAEAALKEYEARRR
jgi:hypothetical protein